MNSGKYTPIRLAISIVCSLVAGFCAASLYATFRHGFTGEAMMTFSVFAFLYEAPPYVGYASPIFYHGLAIIFATSAFILLCQLFLSMRDPEHHGTARWAGVGEMRYAGYLQRYSRIKGPIFGKICGPRWFGSYLTNGDQPHSLIVAPTRAGKGVGVVIPTLLTFQGSVIALDVKGELFELTSRARKSSGDAVFKFSPLDPERRTHCYNPVLDIAALPPERRFTETRRLAANLITAKGKGAEGFIDGARDLFVAGILSCIERGTPTIGSVYDLFAQPGEKYKLFAKLAEETQNKEAQRIFDNMAGNDTKILTSYTSVLGDGGLNLWADPLVKAATSQSDFSVYDLRRKRTCIYLCVSPNDLEVVAPLMRLLFQQVVSILQRTLPVKDERHEVLFLLDEFKHLGKLEAVETAITTIAGYKGRFMFIIQSLSALTGTYDEAGKQNFLSNTGVQVFMATADDETPTYISKAIGEYTFQARSTSYSQARMFDHNIQISDQGAPLLRPEQVRLLDDNYEIVLIKGQPPLKLRKVRYYSDFMLKRIFESQAGSLPEPASLMLPEDTNLFGDNLSQRATGTTMLEAVQIEPTDYGEADTSLTKTMVDGEDSVAIGMEVYPGSNEVGDIGECSGSAAAEPVSEMPPEIAPALLAQRELLEQIISLQRRGEIAPDT
ncbi:type IV secretion system ATPase VirD4 [Agrobacterium vitis]|uniref:type IV secretion system ATPase VirD4 n=1 Tax=Agrobacterium vitis TaxID=373 RepID=UPI0012E74807|nr:type IV secretion system ATPase VirD4 [Agrobacterium vitis]MUZ66221.1 type IV secretion system ATPase VirD4 [Agrobacterium vitis]